MNKILSAAFIILLFTCSNSYSQDSLSAITKDDFERNLIVGVKSGNLGLQVSSAYYLGEIESEKAVIPLMEILKSGKEPSARIMAALSLFKIGDSRGMFAIQRAITFDQDEQVRKMCGILYNMYQSGSGKKENK